MKALLIKVILLLTAALTFAFGAASAFAAPIPSVSRDCRVGNFDSKIVALKCGKKRVSVLRSVLSESKSERVKPGAKWQLIFKNGYGRNIATKKRTLKKLKSAKPTRPAKKGVQR